MEDIFCEETTIDGAPLVPFACWRKVTGAADVIATNAIAAAPTPAAAFVVWARLLQALRHSMGMQYNYVVPSASALPSNSVLHAQAAQ